MPDLGKLVLVSSADDLERAIDDLFSGPLERFTAARNALEKRMKTEGDHAGARRVRGLRKPVRSAWALDRLVREDRDALGGLASVGERLRAAQRRALSGAGAEELRRRTVERRKLVGALTRRAATLLGGGDAPAATVEEIAATLEAASVDEDAARAVLEGRLSKPLPRPAGFGEVVGLKAVPSGSKGRTPAERPTDDRAELRRRERELKAAEERERRARREAERLRADLGELQDRATTARQRLRVAEAEARGAALEVRRLRR